MCGEFWLYRWLELLDGSSLAPIRLELFATSQVTDTDAKNRLVTQYYDSSSYCKCAHLYERTMKTVVCCCSRSCITVLCRASCSSALTWSSCMVSRSFVTADSHASTTSPLPTSRKYCTLYIIWKFYFTYNTWCVCSKQLVCYDQSSIATRLHDMYMCRYLYKGNKVNVFCWRFNSNTIFEMCWLLHLVRPNVRMANIIMFACFLKSSNFVQRILKVAITTQDPVW